MRRIADHSHRGVALVIVLSMIVLMTALVVGFTVNMRTERQAAHTMSENERTKLVAETALAHAIGILSSNIPQPVPPIQPVNGIYPPPPVPVNWAVNPGLLSVITGPSTVTRIPLSTNPSVNYVSTADDANLNALQATSNQNPVLGTADPMCVAWAPLLQNPAAAASATNPLVARYAFWIDDENAKINVNTAYGKPSGMDYTKVTPGVVTETATSPASTTDLFSLGHPGSVNINVPNTNLSVVNPTLLLNSLKTYGAAKSPEVIKTALNGGTDANAFYQQNKFSLTATSRDPEFNVFGKSRIFMYAGPTGQLDTAPGGGMFQRFRDLDAPMYFHGNENSSVFAKDQTALYYTAASLSSIFARSDWPGMPAVSFVGKWDKDANGNSYTTLYPGLATGAMGKREADQIAWNIVTMGSFGDYTYTSATPGMFAKFGNAIPPGKTGSSGSVNYPNAAVCLGSLSNKAMVPAAPRPMVDEVCLNILPEPNAAGTGYYLKFAMSYGVWLPPGYPAVDFGQTLSDANSTSCDFLVGLTHLEYTVTGGSKTATQKDSKYFASADSYEAVKTGKALLASGTMSPGQRQELLSIINKPADETSVLWYARNGNSGFANNQTGSVLFPNGVVNVDMKMRVYVHNRTPYTSPATQLIPVWDTHDYGAAAAPTTFNPTDPPASSQPTAFAPPLDDPSDYIEFKFSLDLNAIGPTQVTRSLRVADPRTGGLVRSWMPSWDSNASSTADTDSLSSAHNTETDKAIAAGTLQLNKFAYLDMTAGTALPHPSAGMFSLVPTGMQRGIPGSNFKLQPNPNPTTQLPDWLLLDLFASTVSPPVGSTAWADIVKMNATAGKINMNATIYPNLGNFSPPSRLLPLQALFTNTPASASVLQNIASHITTSVSPYAGGGKFYNYPGEICEIKGVADTGSTDFDKEALVRNLIGAITTKSNTFSVWGVAQTIKKIPANHQYGQFETGDLITGEKRFQAIVERYVWPGADGIAGNGHVDSNGKYDSVTQGTTQPGIAPTPATATAYNWEALDGPDAPTYPVASSTDPNNVSADNQYDPYNKNASSSYTGSTTSLLETANNPVRATMKYRVIYFKYLE